MYYIVFRGIIKGAVNIEFTAPFGVFRFLLTSGTIVQQSSQENEIQNLSRQSIAIYL